MIQNCLFCNNKGCEFCDEKRGMPEWWGGGSATQKKYAKAGLHPSGFKLKRGISFQACGNCLHSIRVIHGKGSYLKCKNLDEITRGPGTDMRAKWPACEWWDQDDSGIPF